jgi:hypothetical protein
MYLKNSMIMKNSSLFLILVALFLFVSCKKKKDEVEVMVNDRLEVEETLARGNFSGYQHELSGKAVLVKDTSGNTILRLEDFNMTEGPDVYVYLSRNSTYSSGNVIEVRNLTSGYINSNLNIDIDNSIDHSDYKYVLVYCYQFSALFGTALLE